MAMQQQDNALRSGTISIYAAASMCILLSAFAVGAEPSTAATPATDAPGGGSSSLAMGPDKPERLLDLREHVDPVTHRKYQSVGLPGHNVCHMYFDVLTWSADGRYLIVNLMEDQRVEPFCTAADSRKHLLKHPCKMAAFDTRTGLTRLIDDGCDYYQGVVAPTNRFYYTRKDEVRVCDLGTFERKVIARNPSGAPFYGVPSVSNDGTLMTVYWRDPDGKTRSVGLVNTATGEFKTIVPSSWVIENFEAPNDSLDHPMVNPEYHNIVFFCHNGAGQVPDRMWAVDTDTHELRNIFAQKLMPDGSTGDAVGHEMWSFDGKWMYFVKYFMPVSKIPPTGIMRVDKWNGQAEMVNSDHKYLHQAVSPDERFVVADTDRIPTGEDLESDIVLINLRTRESQVIAHIKSWWNQPGHVHPAFTLDNRKVTFTFRDEQRFLRVGFMDVSDIAEAENKARQLP